jgi:hypothetical protein
MRKIKLSQLTKRLGSRGEQLWLIFVLVNIIAVVSVYISLLYPIYSSRAYAPSLSDELGYYLKAKSFVVNHSVASPVLMEENVSKRWDLGFHGFMYTVLYGTLGRLLGLDSLTIITSHILLLLAAFLLIGLFWKFTAAQKATAILFILSYFVVFMYTFTYMMEISQVLLTVLATLFLLTLYGRDNNAGHRLPLMLGFLACLFVLSFFRISYMLFAVCLIPLARNRKQLLIFIAGFALVFGATFLLTRSFIARYPYGFMARLMPAVQSGDIPRAVQLVIDNIAQNLDELFVSETKGLFFYTAFKYWIVGVALLFLLLGVWKKDRLLLSGGLIGALHLVFLFCFYDAYDWREHRGLAPVYYAFVLILVFRKQRFAILVTYLLLAISFPEVHHRVKNKIVREHTRVAVKERRSTGMVLAVGDLKQQLKGTGEVVTVLLSRDLKKRYPFLPLILPVKNESGRRIRYTYNQTKDPHHLWRRIRVDYILAQKRWKRDDKGLKLKNRWYLLYELRR